MAELPSVAMGAGDVDVLQLSVEVKDMIDQIIMNIRADRQARAVRWQWGRSTTSARHYVEC